MAQVLIIRQSLAYFSNRKYKTEHQSLIGRLIPLMSRSTSSSCLLAISGRQDNKSNNKSNNYNLIILKHLPRICDSSSGYSVET